MKESIRGRRYFLTANVAKWGFISKVRSDSTFIIQLRQTNDHCPPGPVLQEEGPISHATTTRALTILIIPEEEKKRKKLLLHFAQSLPQENSPLETLPRSTFSFYQKTKLNLNIFSALQVPTLPGHITTAQPHVPRYIKVPTPHSHDAHCVPVYMHIIIIVVTSLPVTSSPHVTKIILNT